MKFSRITPAQQIAAKKRRRNPWCKLPPWGVTYNECDTAQAEEDGCALGRKFVDDFWMAAYALAAGSPWTPGVSFSTEAWYVAWLMTKRHLRATGRQELVRLIDMIFYEEMLKMHEYPPFSPQWFSTPEATKRECVDGARAPGVEV